MSWIVLSSPRRIRTGVKRFSIRLIGIDSELAKLVADLRESGRHRHLPPADTNAFLIRVSYRIKYRRLEPLAMFLASSVEKPRHWTTVFDNPGIPPFEFKPRCSLLGDKSYDRIYRTIVRRIVARQYERLAKHGPDVIPLAPTLH